MAGEYFALIEKALTEAFVKEEQSLRKLFDTGDDDEWGEFRAEMDIVEHSFEDDLIPSHRYSFVVLLHVLLETTLRSVCLEIQKERGLSISLGDLAGSPMDKVHKFLTKVVGCSVPSEWNQLRNLQVVRDCIVHTHGLVKDSRDKESLTKLASQGDGLAINQDDRLVIEPQFCTTNLNHLKDFFAALFLQIGWEK